MPRLKTTSGGCTKPGKGVPQNDSKAVEWYRKAAEQGYARAQCNLGWMYDNGKGVSQNDSKAVEWYRKAAEQGYATAQNNLGWMYKNGEGVEKNPETAYMWFYLAVTNGYEKARKGIDDLESKGLLNMRELSSAEIQRAKERARQFMEEHR